METRAGSSSNPRRMDAARAKDGGSQLLCIPAMSKRGSWERVLNEMLCDCGLFRSILRYCDYVDVSYLFDTE